MTVPELPVMPGTSAIDTFVTLISTRLVNDDKPLGLSPSQS
jgi:hypothetical protein